MRGDVEQQLDVFSYISLEQRVPQGHPLRPLRAMADEALRELQPRFRKLYAKSGRPSIAPEKLLRARLLQVLYSVRSERMLIGSTGLQPVVPVVRGSEYGRRDLGCHGVYEEPPAPA